MVWFMNLLHRVRTCTKPKVQGAGACLLMNPNLAAGSGLDNLQTCTGRFEPGCTHKHFVHLNCLYVFHHNLKKINIKLGYIHATDTKQKENNNSASKNCNICFCVPDTPLLFSL